MQASGHNRSTITNVLNPQFQYQFQFLDNEIGPYCTLESSSANGSCTSSQDAHYLKCKLRQLESVMLEDIDPGEDAGNGVVELPDLEFRKQMWGLGKVVHLIGGRWSSTYPDTGFHDSPNGLRVVSKRLCKLAKAYNVPFEFNTEVGLKSVRAQPGESLAVNFAYVLHQMPDESVSTRNDRDRILRLVKSMKPKVVTLVEQESNTNTSPFYPRFLEALDYYNAMFESIDITLPREHKERINVEQHCLARDVVNIIACEGDERVERHELLRSAVKDEQDLECLVILLLCVSLKMVCFQWDLAKRQQSHPTGLANNLLKLFEPRAPLEYKPPPEKIKCLPYTDMRRNDNENIIPNIILESDGTRCGICGYLGISKITDD
ncbi:scarecrow-like protein 21 [Tanacetum coccineum]